MTNNDILIGVVLDDVALTLDELAQACGVEPRWIVERVEGEMLGRPAELMTCWRFTSAGLVRTRRLAAIERSFDANPELAALVVDLIEQCDRLKAQLK